MRKRLMVAIFVCLMLSISWTAVAETPKEKFWRCWAGGDYVAARDVVLEVAAESPGYFVPAYYLYSFAYKHGDCLSIIKDEIAFTVAEKDIDMIYADLSRYLTPGSPSDELARAILLFSFLRDKAGALKLVDQSLSQQKSAFGYFLSGTFRSGTADEAKPWQECLHRAPGAANARLRLYYHYVRSGASQAQQKRIIREMLASDDWRFGVEDYRNMIACTLGEGFDSAIGPGGPNGEPAFATLYFIEDWATVKDASPVQKVFLAYSIGIGGSQNTGDAETLLSQVDPAILAAHDPLITILRSYECFHVYDYDGACRHAKTVLNQTLDPEFYFMPLYDLGYQFEMFFFHWRKDVRLIETSIALYEKSNQMRPKWSKAYAGYVLLSLGRSQYYAGRYLQSALTLHNALNEVDYPMFYFILALDFYRLGDAEAGAFWEQKTRRTLGTNRAVMQDFEKMLKEAKSGS